MPEKIKITFLGTADQIPSVKRNSISILLNYKEENILIDCGEGTQRQFRKANLNPCKVSRILITHWHGDHILGIPGLLSTFALSGYNKTLHIYGPKGTKTFMNQILEIFKFRRNYKIKVEEVDGNSGKFFETKDFYLEAKSMTHRIPCNSYVFVRKGMRKINKRKLLETKLPAGPLLRKLKEGKDILYKNKKFKSKNLTFKEDNKKISFVLDTSLNKDIVPFVKNSDLLVCESCFGSELEEHAKEYKHLTAKQAGEIAKKAEVEKLILIHISQRYKNSKKILKEAKNIFKNTRIAEDFDRITVE
jgi:ribonuclease Z